VRKPRRLFLVIAAAAIVLGICAVSAYAALTDDTTAPVTTSDAVSSYWNGATVTLSATDDSGVAYIYYKLDQSYVHLYRVGSGASETSVAVAAPATGSAAHTLKFWAQDNAGNVEKPTTVTLTVAADTTAPVTVASGVTDGAWYKAARVIHLVATDEVDGSGVATLTSTLDLGAPVVVAAASTDVNITVDATTHANDGAHTLTYQAADVAGNIESLKTITVNIDTRRPVPKAPYAASVYRGHTATLKYRVVDLPPNSGTAAVVIKVKNSAGKLVKTLQYASKPVNMALTAKFTVPGTWKRGTYRFYVYATDGAGNTQLKAASNKLIVK
jgi:hypothetical protein